MDDGSEARAAATASTNGFGTAATNGVGGGGTTEATDPEAGLGGEEETTPTSDPEEAVTAATNGVGGGDTTEAADPDGAATTATNGVDGGEAPEAEQQYRNLLRAYAARYSGRTLVSRLVFIARRCVVESTELDVLRMALEETRNGRDTMIYGDICNLINGRIGPHYDRAWVQDVIDKFNQNLQALQAEIDVSQEGRMKKYTDMGRLYYSHGYLADAMKCYMKTEELITSPDQQVQLCLHAVLINLELGEFDRVLKYVHIAEGSQSLLLDAVTAAKFHAAAGLAHLGKMEYRLAALKFLETGPELENNYSEVILPEDVAVYGALCAIASFDSAEMKIKVMENTSFGYFLQLLQPVQQLVQNFYLCRHVSCMKDLEDMKPSLLLDIYLSDHVETLYLVISQKSGYMVVPEDAGFEDLFRTSSPIANEGEEEEEEETRQQNVVVSNLVLHDQFDEETPLSLSAHYNFLNAKELIRSIGKKSLSWISRLHAHTLLVNASLFVHDSIRDDEDKFDGCMVVVSESRYSTCEAQYRSYTTTQKPLKETRMKDNEDSAIDRFQIKGNIWTRRRICLKDDHSFHLLQWRKTAGLRRAHVEPPEAAPLNENTQLNETMKSLIEELKGHRHAMTQTTEALTQTRQTMIELNCSIAEARKTAATATTGGVAT